MFYNLLTGEVEDFTGKGLEDLEKGRIRTPLDPYVTFKDDPLRILRCFRFAGRFKFEVDPVIFEAVTKADIRTALRTKVSKERIGKEISLMLKAEDPSISLRYIQENKLWDLVFEVPESSNLKDQTMMPKVSLLMLERMQALLNQTKLETLPVMGKLLVHPDEEVH
jgi:tRNA nucleotidyltransferase (CCA-adding enzyme)